MSTAKEAAPPTQNASGGTNEKSSKGQPNPQNEQKAENKPGDTSETPKLTNAQLKAKQKAERAARRIQAKASKEVAKGEAAVSSAQGPLGPSAAEVKGAKAKGKQDNTGASSTAGKMTGSKGSAPVAPSEPKLIIPECFSHLSMAKRTPMTQADKDVHPTVLALGQQMATFAIDESMTRLKATLLAFKKVISSYNTPPGNTLARHLTPHVLNPQIDYLTACRPMCFSMGNAIRWLKLQVSKIDPDVPEEDAKKKLCTDIDNFIQDRITVARFAVIDNAVQLIQDGDVIMTYGRSSLFEETVLQAHNMFSKKFSVIIVDDPYDTKGQALAKTLTSSGLKVSYCGDFGGLRWHTQQAMKVMLSAEAMFNNGSMYARAGSSDVTITARELGIPVLVLCESINITERVATDSITYNEIDPEYSSAAAFRLLYDTTLGKYLSMIVTEIGNVQPASMPNLLRKLEESN